MTPPPIIDMRLESLLARCPWIKDFFNAHDIDLDPHLNETFRQMTARFDDRFFDDLGTERERFVSDFTRFVEGMRALATANQSCISTLAITPGMDKTRQPEPAGAIFRMGEVTAIVGPTGSGKSRLLEDVECLAQGDTPTGRFIHIDGATPSDEMRFATEERLIAQLSQNMNFVMDLTAEDFVTMHAESRMVTDIGRTVSDILNAANALAGEPFARTQPLTQLSGGQSRALMIADTALLSAAPIVLIDEIENAGVDKIKALELLVSTRKIVLISTHDPLLALSAHQRIVIRNGGMQKVLVTSDSERQTLARLKIMDRSLSAIRAGLRNGEVIDAEALSK